MHRVIIQDHHLLTPDLCDKKLVENCFLYLRVELPIITSHTIFLTPLPALLGLGIGSLAP